jgi:hypothetical protein
MTLPGTEMAELYKKIKKFRSQLKIIRTVVSLSDIWVTRESAFEDMIKIVVDVENEIIAMDAELHADLEQLLMENGSRQEVLWGANIYPDKGKNSPDFIEYTALINVRPSSCLSYM